MHSRDYLSDSDFVCTRGATRAALAEVLAPWSPGDRIAFIVPDPVADLASLAGPVLAWTQRFYGRDVARQPGFFDYPRHFVIGGEPAAAPRVLGPNAGAAWSPAWCRLDMAQHPPRRRRSRSGESDGGGVDARA
jgi:hypothetical protein